MRAIAKSPPRSLPELEAEAAELRAGIEQAETAWKAIGNGQLPPVARAVDNTIKRLREKLKVLEMRIAKMGQEPG